MMDPLHYRLRRRIDALSDELEQANAHIARLTAQHAARVRHRNRTCVYCGVRVAPRARTCAEHKPLLALDPFYVEARA